MPPLEPDIGVETELFPFTSGALSEADILNRNYDGILEDCATAWNWLIADPARIRSIGSRERARVNL